MIRPPSTRIRCIMVIIAYGLDRIPSFGQWTAERWLVGRPVCRRANPNLQEVAGAGTEDGCPLIDTSWNPQEPSQQYGDPNVP